MIYGHSFFFPHISFRFFLFLLFLSFQEAIFPSFLSSSPASPSSPASSSSPSFVSCFSIGPISFISPLLRSWTSYHKNSNNSVRTLGVEVWVLDPRNHDLWRVGEMGIWTLRSEMEPWFENRKVWASKIRVVLSCSGRDRVRFWVQYSNFWVWIVVREEEEDQLKQQEEDSTDPEHGPWISSVFILQWTRVRSTDREVVKSWRARDWSANSELGCIRKWCPGVVELECPSVVCADSRRVYPEVASECIVVWCPSVGARIFERRVCPSIVSIRCSVSTGLDLEPHGTSLKAVYVTPSV